MPGFRILTVASSRTHRHRLEPSDRGYFGGAVAHRFRTIRARNTTLAGYGAAHQRERKKRVAVTTERDLCGYCHRPLGPKPWALPHNADRTGYLPGMWHIPCNNLDGAKRGNQRQRARRGVKRAQSRAW